MNARELRTKYLAFFQSKGHSPYPSGSLVPYDVTGRLDESLLFNGAGMIQFKPYFRGSTQPTNKRLTTAQKCLRTGDIEEVGDASHLTFFEMLGNFSFGDYFKKDAIAYSWEFLTAKEWLGLDPARLAFTIFEDDDEAGNEWHFHLNAHGIDPESRLFRLGEASNYWPAGSFSKGPPGPCGPNSEMFYWTSPDPVPIAPYSREEFVRDEAAGKWLEIWNDVFITSEWQGELRDPSRPDKGYAKSGMPDLPFRSVDTGMGLERTTVVLNGLKTVYDTDVFEPIFRKLLDLAGFDAFSPEQILPSRVIADHIRAACFCIADGVLPSNGGRGYVLRRLIRRAILKGSRGLGIADVFLVDLVDAVIEALGDHYTELVDRRAVMIETLRNEEIQFRRTLGQGSQMLAEKLEGWRTGAKAKSTPLPGDLAFMLYDTYGFPLEITEELCREIGVPIDREGYEAAMLEAQERSRGASAMDTVYGGVGVNFQFVVVEGVGPKPTDFLGYDATDSEATIVGAVPMLLEDASLTGELVIALDRSPFYAESGGQVADTGVLKCGDLVFPITDVIKQDGVWVHLASAPAHFDLASMAPDRAIQFLQKELFGRKVVASVNSHRRRDVIRNHTATHLMHAALRDTLGPHVSQAGSLVSPEQLRFDFNHGKAMTPAELAQVEEMVNRQILEAQPIVTYRDIPIQEARAMGAMALFGEKYADYVRVVQVGGMPPTERSFSRELCGGIHVRNTGEIGLFKILHEASTAGGVRRITAVTGFGSYRWALEQQSLVHAAAQRLKTSPKDLLLAVDKALDSLKEEKKKREKLVAQGAGSSQAQEVQMGNVVLVIEQPVGLEPADAKLVANRLVEGRPNAVGLVLSVDQDMVSVVCKVGAGALDAGAHAGNIVKAVATATGGGGGGRPDFATAGGRDVSKLAEAIAAACDVLKSQLKI